MKKNVKEYFANLKGVLDRIIVTGKDAKVYQFDRAIDISIQMIIERAARGGKLLFIGNGANAALASHIATDFWKSAGIRALAFNDSSLLTCVSNDYGYKHVFEKPIEMFVDNGDILFAISSSGKSENILRAVSVAKVKKAKILTFSGFKKDNPLRKLGNINFYVPQAQYGNVEIAHLSICHCIVDRIIELKNG